MQYKISVALASYNGEKYIANQIKSILNQLGKDDEIILSDNYSTDKTINIVKSFNDKRIKIFFKKQLSKDNIVNCIQNFENALANCSGDYIFLSDQDDIWLDNKISIMVDYLGVYDIVNSDCIIIDENDKIIVDSYFEKRNSGKGLIKNLIANNYFGCCMAFKKEVVQLLLPFPKKIPLHDIYIGFVGELFFKTYFANEKLVLYRGHSDNLSPTAFGSKYNFINKLIFRFKVIMYLPKLIYRRFKIKIK